jgi:hypothetical protein
MTSAGVTYRAGLGQDSPPRADGRQTRMILRERTAISNVLRSDASDKTAKQNESDDHFRLADDPPSDRSDGKNQTVDGEFGRGRERLRKRCRQRLWQRPMPVSYRHWDSIL